MSSILAAVIDDTPHDWQLRDSHVERDAQRLAHASDWEDLTRLEASALRWIGLAATHNQPRRTVTWAATFEEAARQATARLDAEWSARIETMAAATREVD